MSDAENLPSALAALVEAERAAPTGTTAMRDQILDRLVSSHGEAALSMAGVTGGAGSTAAAASTSLAVKLVVLATVAAGFFGVGFWVGVERREVIVVKATDEDERMPLQVPGAASLKPEAIAPVVVADEPRPTSMATATAEENDLGTASAIYEPISAPPRPPSQPAVVEAPAAADPETPPQSPDGRESQLLRDAWDSYDAGAYDQAVRSLESHAKAFATGLLAEEREALWVRVLVDAGEDDAARQRATSFHNAYPESIHGRIVRRSISRISTQKRQPPGKE